MEIGEKSFLITDSDLEPINTKLDTVIGDTTTLKSTTNTIYCEANNPMFLLGVNKSTSQDITINTLNMTVEILEN